MAILCYRIQKIISNETVNWQFVNVHYIVPKKRDMYIMRDEDDKE